jgi:DNA-binding HxlR family transcriptional regulator
MALLDLLGRRWALRILWELREEAPRSFNELQRACGPLSPSVLSQRLAELRESQLVEQDRQGRYRPTPLARELEVPLLALDSFAKRWARRRTRAAARRRRPQ